MKEKIKGWKVTENDELMTEHAERMTKCEETVTEIEQNTTVKMKWRWKKWRWKKCRWMNVECETNVEIRLWDWMSFSAGKIPIIHFCKEKNENWNKWDKKWSKTTWSETWINFFREFSNDIESTFSVSPNAETTPIRRRERDWKSTPSQTAKGDKCVVVAAVGACPQLFDSWNFKNWKCGIFRKRAGISPPIL